MRNLLTVCLGTTAAVLLALVLLAVGAAPAATGMPAETVALRPSALPGYAVAAGRCGICHSSDYITYQPPGMTLAQWSTEVAKMRTSYGAPLSTEEARLIAIYLAATYGDAAGIPAAELAAGAAPAPAVTDDVQSLLASHGCLGCHALQHRLVGPSYRDVAMRYRDDPQALTHLAASIRQGGVGRWGAVAMPPFADLGEEQARALAAFVLRP